MFKYFTGKKIKMNQKFFSQFFFQLVELHVCFWDDETHFGIDKRLGKYDKMFVIDRSDEQLLLNIDYISRCLWLAS